MQLDTLFDLVFGLVATLLAILGLFLTYKHRRRMRRVETRLAMTCC